MGTRYTELTLVSTTDYVLDDKIYAPFHKRLSTPQPWEER